MNEKFAELLDDEKFIEEFLSKESVEDAQKYLTTQGVEMSIEELNNFRNAIIARIEGGEELSDEQLENVAGGSKFTYQIDKFVDKIDSWKNEHITRPIQRALNNFFRRW
ncbi:MAG: hypothetical protein IJ728_09950 [Selenomonadaceae bacterium]|nr:hypothetical protein [Selenomonadaceae bacterium]